MLSMVSTPTFQRLKAVIERRDNRAGRVFDSCIQILIVIVLIAFTIETLPALPETLHGFLSKRGFARSPRTLIGAARWV